MNPTDHMAVVAAIALIATFARSFQREGASSTFSVLSCVLFNIMLIETLKVSGFSVSVKGLTSVIIKTSSEPGDQFSDRHTGHL